MSIYTISELALNGKKLFDELSSKKIAIDIDGTVAESVEHFLKLINEEHKIDLKCSDVFLWDTKFPSINKSMSDIEEYFRYYDFVKSVETYKYSVDIINFLYLITTNIVFVTDRPSIYDDDTRTWLQYKLFPHTSYMNTRYSGKKNVKADVLIDDKFDIAYEFACEDNKRLSIIPVRPWNKMYRTDEISNILNKNNLNITWFYSWDEVPGILFNYYLRNN